MRGSKSRGRGALLKVLAATQSLALALFAMSCTRAASAGTDGTAGNSPPGAVSRGSAVDNRADPRLESAFAALDKASTEMGKAESASIRARILAAPGPFLDGLDTVLAERALDSDRFARVDKVAPPLGPTFVPDDLVSLNAVLPVARQGLELRKGAAEALAEMAKAAKADGVRLVAGSAYRSWNYQKTVFEREVKVYGEAVAKSESAEPGRSQHQLGVALDFSPIDDVFAKSPAFAWLSAHAGEYGFSRSYPDGMETVTGYRPESWHWRWIGKPAARLQADYFDGVQQYLIEFLSDY